MEAYGSTTTTDQSSSHRWASMVIIFVFLLFTSQVASEVALVTSPQDVVAAEGQTVTLTCVFNQSVICNWSRADQPFAIKPEHGYTYTAGQSSSSRSDCSITISAVRKADFAKWRCASPRPSQSIWIIEQVTPSAPVISFKKRVVSELKLPSSEAPTELSCRCEKGNPPPQLWWQVNGTQFLGKLEKTEVKPHLYTVKLDWQAGWQTFANASEVICIANHSGFATPVTAKLQFKRDYAPKTVKVYGGGSNEVSVKCGDKVTLSCIADGEPSPTYTWESWSEEDKAWKLCNNSRSEQNISVTFDQVGKYRCKASNDLNKYSPTPSLNEIAVVQSNELAVKVEQLKSISRDVAITAGVLVTILVITVIVLTLIVIKLRRKLKRQSGVCPAPLPTLVQLNPTSSPPSTGNRTCRDDNVYAVDPNKFSRGVHPSTSSNLTAYYVEEEPPEEVEYCNVSRADIESCVYLDPMEVTYDEVTERPPVLSRPRQLKGVDVGYIVLH